MKRSILVILSVMTNIALSYGQFDTNSITLKFNGTEFSLEHIYSLKGEIYESANVPVLVDPEKLIISINGKLPDKTKFYFSAYKMKDDCKPDSAVLEKISGLALPFSFKDTYPSGFTSAKLPDRLVLVFQYDKGKEFPICLRLPEKKKAGISDPKANSQELCKNPKFYLSGYLQPIDQDTVEAESFYLIEHNFSNINDGPQIFLMKSKSTPGQPLIYERQRKKTLIAGHSARAVFKYYHPEYDRVALTLTFKDYNKEDASLFQSLMGLTKPDATATANGEKKDEDSPATGEEVLLGYENVVTVMIRDFTSFDSDVTKYMPSSAVFNIAMALVKQNIKSCIPGLTMITPASLGEVLSAASEDSDYRAKVEQVTLLLIKLERYSAFLPPAFQIKNADELKLDVAYYTPQSTTPVYSRDHDFAILGGWKIDFSTGFIFSDLVNKSFLITDADEKIKETTLIDGTIRRDTIAMKSIIEQENSKFRVGFGIFSHFYPRLSRYFSVGITTGFMVKDNLAVQFPIGASVMLGRGSRIVLSGGKVYGERSELSSKYKLNTPVEASSLTNVTEDNLTVNRFKSGWFFALTYNFGGTNIGK